MDTSSVRRFAVDGCELEYSWIGSPPGSTPTIVFLHEGLGSLASWGDFPEAVCRRTGLGGLVYSRRGHGRSSPLAAPHDPRFMHHEAQVVLPQVLAAFSIGDFILFGHSDGGSIALIYTGAGLGRPRGLVLEAPHVRNAPSIVSGIAEVRTRYRTGRLRARLARYHGANADSLFDAWCNVWTSPGFRDWNLEEYLPGVTAPTLVIQGVNDQYETEDQVQSIADGIAGPCDTLMIPDCGHLAHVDQPEIVEDATVRFITRLMAHGLETDEVHR